MFKNWCNSCCCSICFSNEAKNQIVIEKDEDTGIVICEVNLIDEFSSEPLNSSQRRKEEKVCSSIVPKTSFDPRSQLFTSLIANLQSSSRNKFEFVHLVIRCLNFLRGIALLILTKCKTSFYILTNICLQGSERLGPKYFHCL